MDDIAAQEIEGEQTGGAESVVAMIDGPQPVPVVDHQPEHCIEKVWLHGAAGIGYGGTSYPFEKFVTSLPRLGMYRKEYPSVTSNRDITDRLGVAEDFFQLRIVEKRRRRHIRIGLATAVAHAQDDCRKYRNYQQNQQEISQ